MKMPEYTTVESYSDVRDRIKNGDIVFLARGKKLSSKITQFFTGSPFFHVGIAFWITVDSLDTKRLFIVEANVGGRRIISLSSYAHYNMVVIENPAKWVSYCQDLLVKTGSVSYSYKDLLSIGLWETLQIKLKDYKGQVCSELISNTIRDNTELRPDQLISPGKLFDFLKKHSKILYQVK